MNWYLKVLKQYADFKGRARRSEYWMFTLFNIIFSGIAVSLDNAIGLAQMGVGPIYGLYALAMLIPGLAVAVRRLHDVGKKGAMLFVVLIPVIGSLWLLFLLVKDSDPNENAYGANPKLIPV
ncbi:DUF805 domain-containing protein [Flagellimonas flava]|uniref:DUF805 domain-containing protein n=1 Tax=Flagellimonas flava TaxID=570519 RepID=UPI003D655BF0